MNKAPLNIRNDTEHAGGNDELVWFLGWKDIEKATGFKRRTLRSMMKEKGFPIKYVGGRPVTTAQALTLWLLKEA